MSDNEVSSSLPVIYANYSLFFCFLLFVELKASCRMLAVVLDNVALRLAARASRASLSSFAILMNNVTSRAMVASIKGKPP